MTLIFRLLRKYIDSEEDVGLDSVLNGGDRPVQHGLNNDNYNGQNENMDIDIIDECYNHAPLTFHDIMLESEENEDVPMAIENQASDFYMF